MNNNIKAIYKQFVTEGVWLELRLSPSFEPGIYNYNVAALYMDDSDSTIPVGKFFHLGQF